MSTINYKKKIQSRKPFQRNLINDYLLETSRNYDDFYDFDDDGYWEDFFYESSYNYAIENSQKFYDNINIFKYVFTEDCLNKIKQEKSAIIDCTTVYLDIGINDIIGRYKSDLLKNIFISNNKHGFKISVIVEFKDYDFQKIYKLAVCIYSPFGINSNSLLYNQYKFNKNYSLNVEKDFSKIDFIEKVISNKKSRNEFPDSLWSLDKEDQILFYFIDKLDLSSETLSLFNIKDLIENPDLLSIFKAYLL